MRLAAGNRLSVTKIQRQLPEGQKAEKPSIFLNLK